MALSTGKEIGRVNVRVVPNVKRFNDDLRRQLARQKARFEVPAHVTKAEVDRERVQASLNRQLKGLHVETINIDTDVNVRGADVDRVKIRESIQRQIDGMNFKMKIHAKVANPNEFVMQVRRMVERAANQEMRFKPQKIRVEPELDKDPFAHFAPQSMKVKPSLDDHAIERVKRELYAAFGDDHFDKRLEFAVDLSEKSKLKFEHAVNHLLEKYDGKSINFNVGMSLLLARARLAAFTRTRILPIAVRLSKRSLLVAAQQLATFAAAASGTRLVGKWLDDILDAFKNLDKNAPMIMGVTTALTSAFAAIMAGGAGLVGVAGDIAKMGPALLVLPGLVQNMISSAIVMFVALKNAKTELAELSDDMSELGEIINKAFWTEAREPIVNMTKTLMPQLRNAIGDTARATGRFTGEMARAFEENLGGGRLESIFAGINEWWDILAEGAGGFAGAIVNLSQIGARYMPGLAQWFSDLAGEFDAWLTKISTSDQLDTWISNAVFEMEEFWRATKNAYSFLQALYDAANAAGGTGLTGLANAMGAWSKIANSAMFQKGLAAVFRGSMGAMEDFGEAVKAIGRLIGDNSEAFERFIASSGEFLAGLVEGIANALNDPAVIGGLNEFSDGLIRGVGKIVDTLNSGPFASVFGEFLELLGGLAGDLIPSAVEALSNLMPTIEAIISPIKDALPGLGNALVRITDALGPSAERLAGALSEALIAALVGFADAIERLGPILTPVLDGLAAVVSSITGFLGGSSEVTGEHGLAFNVPTFEDQWIEMQFRLKYDGDMRKDIEGWIGDPVTIGMIADTEQFIRSFGLSRDEAVRLGESLYGPATKKEFQNAADEIATLFLKSYENTVATQGQPAADALVNEIYQSDLAQEVKDVLVEKLQGAGNDVSFIEADAAERIFGEMSGVAELGGGDAAKAFWDGLDKNDQSLPWTDAQLDWMHRWGIEVEGVMDANGNRLVGGFATGMNGAIVPALGATGSALKAGIEDAFSGVVTSTGKTGLEAAMSLGQGLSSGSPGVVDAVNSLKQAGLVDPMADLNQLLAVPGSEAVLGLVAGLESGQVGVANAAGQIKQAGILDQFNMLSAVMPGVGADSIVSLIDGINSQGGGVSAAAGNIKQTGILDTFTAMSTLLPQAGSDTILGLIEGLNSEGVTLGTTVEEIKQSGILDKYVDADGLLTTKGEEIVGGLVEGMDSQKSALGTTSSGLKDDDILKKFLGLDTSMNGIGGGAGSELTKGLKKYRYDVERVSDDLRKKRIMQPFAGIENRFGDIGGGLGTKLSRGMSGKGNEIGRTAQSLRSDRIMDKFAGIENRFGDIGGGLGSKLARGMDGRRREVGISAGTLRSDGVMQPFAGIESRFGDIGGGVSGGLARGVGRLGATRGAAQSLRRDGVMQPFSGIGSRFSTIGGEVSGNLGSGMSGHIYRVSSAARSIVTTMSSILQGIIGIAEGIGRGITSAIQGAVSAAISWASGQTYSAPKPRDSATLGGSMSLGSRGDSFVLPSSFTASRASTVVNAGDTNIEVTMPLLPKETPAEQRDTLIRELRNAMA
ncbi:MAG: hypothetical protein ACTH4Y_08020 [Microbacterium gubbeenense]|uniref:hypothetical protein n=1 Tax=Microbacterium gubbeenense TaxID=159896 RepID=UPI003F9A522D